MIDPRSLPSAVALEEVLRRGNEALAAGHVDGALRTFDAALRVKPAYAPAWRAKGRALRVAGDARAAVDCYAEALRHEPDDEANWLGLALALHALGRRTDEVRAYDEVLRRDPRNVAAWTNKGVALHEAGAHAEALACCDRILALRPEVAAAWSNRGAALLRLGRFEEALDSFDEALALDPGFADAAANRRAVLGRIGRDASPPTAYVLPQGASLTPALAARVLANLGLPAIAAWQSARSEGPDDLVALGTALFDEGNPDAAKAAFGKARASGAGPVAAVGRLLAFQVLADPEAPEEATRLLAAHPDVARVVVAVARVREGAGDLDGAAEALAGLVASRPDLGWIWNWKGLLDLELGRWEDARMSFEAATSADPDDAEAWTNLAAALHKEGNDGTALTACDRALALDPGSAAAENNRAVVLAAMGRVGDAERSFQRAAKEGREPGIVLNRAQHAEAGGRHRAALSCYDSLLQTDPRNAEALAARRRLLGRLGAQGRSDRKRLLERLCAVSGVGPGIARRLVDAGLDSAAKIRRAVPRTLREAARLTPAQVRAVKAAFRT